jgi:hypothetical protein
MCTSKTTVSPVPSVGNTSPVIGLQPTSVLGLSNPRGCEGLNLLLRYCGRLPDGVRLWNRCFLHLLLLELGGFESKHYEGLGSHARSWCVVDLSTAVLLFTLSNGVAAEA